MVSTRHRPSPSVVAETEEPNKEVEKNSVESKEENAAHASNIRRKEEIDPPPSAKRMKGIAKTDTSKLTTGVGEVEQKISSETFEFDKAKAVQKINAIVQNEPNVEGHAKIPKTDNESRAIKAALSNMETIYKEIEELRSNEVEQLLEDTRATAAAKEQSQQALIEELKARIEFLQNKIKNAGPSDEEIKVREEHEKSAKIKDASESLTSTETSEMMNLCKCYARLTGVSVKIEDGIMICTVKNNVKRRAVKFHITNADKKSIEFQPVGNKHLLPPELQEVGFFKASEAPILIARIVESLDV
eukprot:CAMPEP_0204838046 /NCGR_PEP_ID=MMETSP1346-20131115/29681_1 /ASSEMBLY_ACC=CAM_ASM_000771 /TAXON_ID=215587 /ORGANISM="Aplanochytrium stocchinoi, Strain GSBS06" /LENGTH=301 /DNA_ID=CAMNT_0051973851 /DNA_START=55 /DNA_END=960 /DNA_ORIENTATION=+